MHSFTVVIISNFQHYFPRLTDSANLSCRLQTCKYVGNAHHDDSSTSYIFGRRILVLIPRVIESAQGGELPLYQNINFFPCGLINFNSECHTELRYFFQFKALSSNWISKDSWTNQSPHNEDLNRTLAWENNIWCPKSRLWLTNLYL